MRLVDAIQDGLRLAMQQHPDLVLMGQDIAEYGGVFKITEGFVEEFGRERVRNTPICESAIVGAAMGLSLAGHKSMVEMQFSDFVSCGFNQIVNNLAKNHYRWGHAPDVVLRMPTGGGVGAGPFHSQSIESWFTQVPGLKVVYPATPADAKGLLASAILDPNPVLFFEHKALYRSVTGEVPTGYYHLPIGKARVVQAGEDLSLITYGMGVHWAEQVLGELDASVELIDLRSLMPWDQETVFASVRKTGKCLVLYEATATGAFGGEVAAAISEHCFEHLDGPVRRLGAMDTPVPFHPELEKDFLPLARLKESLLDLLGY
jgi:2-oxoisovalerate dehydrogenase E1 component